MATKGWRPHSRKKPRPPSSNLLPTVEASCSCGVEWIGSDARTIRDAARYHARTYRHIVSGHVATPFRYDGKRPEPQS